VSSETGRISSGGQDAARDGAADAVPDAAIQAEELLIEEISIDGMCGVY
jgi:mycofactocin precursor